MGERRRCHPAETTSCTSSLCHGNCSLLSFHQLLSVRDTQLSSLPSLLLVSALLSLRTTPLITLLVTSLAPTLSMSSLVLVLPGPWLPSTGKLRERPSLSLLEAWDSL